MAVLEVEETLTRPRRVSGTEVEVQREVAAEASVAVRGVRCGRAGDSC